MEHSNLLMLPENLWEKNTPIIEKKTSAYSNLKVNIAILEVDHGWSQYTPLLLTGTLCVHALGKVTITANSDTKEPIISYFAAVYCEIEY